LKRKVVVSDDLSYLVFSEIYLRYNEPKTRRKAFAILESAIDCYHKKGFESVTYKMVARQSGLTPSTLRHYFSNLNEIQEVAVKYIHMTAQKIVVEMVNSSKSPDEMLKKYLEGHANWATHFHRHTCVWLHFISFSSRRKRERALNSEAVSNGTLRISEMLSRGRKAGVFNHKNDLHAARIIQTIIFGWISSLVTEDIENPKQYTQLIVDHCLRVVTVN
jgi:AcrR family transcriptional regulator